MLFALLCLAIGPELMEAWRAAEDYRDFMADPERRQQALEELERRRYDEP